MTIKGLDDAERKTSKSTYHDKILNLLEIKKLTNKRDTTPRKLCPTGIP